MRHLMRHDPAQASPVVVGCIAEHEIVREIVRIEEHVVWRKRAEALPEGIPSEYRLKAAYRFGLFRRKIRGVSSRSLIGDAANSDSTRSSMMGRWPSSGS